MPAWNRKPRTTKKGEVRHSVGYVDERGRERTKGGFSTERGTGGANHWIKRYRAAEALGRSELAAFLDYEVRGISPEEQTPSCETVDQGMAEFLLVSHPDAPGGLAAQTHRSYMQVYRKHIRPRLGTRALTDLSGPGPAADLRDEMIKAGVGAPTIKRALSALSSMVSWAVEREKLSANGVRLIQQRSRRSNRRSASGSSSAAGRGSGSRKPGWALAPDPAAHVVHELVTAPNTDPVVRMRDATAAVVQYLTGGRNQDVWGLRWGAVADVGVMHFDEFVSAGQLTDGKTLGSERSAPQSDTLAAWLAAWKAKASAAGLGTSPSDFVFAGNAPEGFMTENQTKRWGSKRFKPACQRVAAAHGDLSFVGAAKQYSLRRGHISVRLRGGEDPARVAKECGTSVQMLMRYYWTDIEAMEIDRAPLDVQFARAWHKVSGSSGPPWIGW